MNNRIIVAYGGTGAAAALTDRATQIERARLGGAKAMAVELRRRYPQLSCHAQAVIGAPSEVLIDASATADLMAVGRSGAGAVGAFVTGLIANAVVRDSGCPTVLVSAPHCRRTLSLPHGCHSPRVRRAVTR